MKILIVEDDENIVRVISDNLTKWGYDVLAVENFNDVMETFNNFKPQLVLLSCCLFLTVIIGVARYVRFLRFPLFSYLPRRKMET